MAVGSTGVLYGTTEIGGDTGCDLGCGTVFSLTAPASPGGSWTETVYLFPGGEGGNLVAGGVVIGPGVLYGTPNEGGLCCGTVFSLERPSSPGGSVTENVLYGFTGGPSDGANPAAGVVIGSGGELDGTTGAGGTFGYGAVFSLTPSASPGGRWSERVLYNFTGGDDGANPAGGVVLRSGGVLYGTTLGGGLGVGTVFSLTPAVSAGGA